MTLGERIALLRGQNKMSQGDLAEKLNVSRQSFSKWETGASIPELDKLIMMSKLFGVTLDELVGSDFMGRATQPTANSRVDTVECGTFCLHLRFSFFTARFGCRFMLDHIRCYLPCCEKVHRYCMLLGVGCIFDCIGVYN